MKAVEPRAIRAFVPTVGIFDRGEFKGAGRGERDAGALLHFGLEPRDSLVSDGVFQSGMPAIGAVSVVPLGCEDGLSDLIHFVCRDEAKEIG